MQEACVGEGLAVTTADVRPAVREDIAMPSGVAEALFGLLGHLKEGHIGDLLRRHARKDGRVAVRWLVVTVNADRLPRAHVTNTVLSLTLELVFGAAGFS